LSVDVAPQQVPIREATVLNSSTKDKKMGVSGNRLRERENWAPGGEGSDRRSGQQRSIFAAGRKNRMVFRKKDNREAAKGGTFD